MRLSLKAFAFSRREKKLPKNGKEEIYHIICLSTGFPWGLWRFPSGNYFPLTQTKGHWTPNKQYTAAMENMPSQLDEPAQATQRTAVKS
ncbi:uncharacterized protein LJ206_013625 isoform 2-T2 [Theristicus caerulescens]